MCGSVTVSLLKGPVTAHMPLPEQPKPALPHQSTYREDSPRGTNRTQKKLFLCYCKERDTEGQNDPRAGAMQRGEGLIQVLHHCRITQSSFVALCACVFLLTAMFGASPGLLGTARPFHGCQMAPDKDLLPPPRQSQQS